MADRQHVPEDLTWYQEQWQELLDLLPTSNPDEVLPHVRQLQIRALGEEEDALEEVGLSDDTDPETVLRQVFGRLQKLRRQNQAFHRVQELLSAENADDLVETVEALLERIDAYEEQKKLFADAGFSGPTDALRALESMKEQLEELYSEKEATEQPIGGANAAIEGDTFDQLQSLIAREEKLQRELGVSDPEAVIEMVEGLSDQLEDLYSDRGADESDRTKPRPAVKSMDGTELLEEAVGSTDPETIARLVTDLTDQLESVYERREQLTEQGISDPEEALSMIENMEAQLSELYDEQTELSEQSGVLHVEEAASQLEALEDELMAVTEERDTLQEKQEHLEARLNAFREEIGIDDPEAISKLIESMDAQLRETYKEREFRRPSEPGISEDSLLPVEHGRPLSAMDQDDLDQQPAGFVALNENGVVRRANQQALHWPDGVYNDPGELLGRDFFATIAPGTNNALFRGRFFDGVDAGEINEQFSYTYVSEGVAPTNLRVHFYSTSDEELYWIAFQVLEQY